MGIIYIFMRTFIAALVLATVAVQAVDRKRRSEPSLVSKGWSPKKLLGMCEGDCDNTHHCKKGLVCFTRGLSHKADLTQSFSANPYQKVPGCKGKGTNNMDYCIHPKQLRHWMKNIRTETSASWFKKTKSMTKACKIKVATFKKSRAAHNKKMAARRRRLHANRKAAHGKRMAYLRKRAALMKRRKAAHMKRMAAKKAAHAKRLSKHAKRMHAHRQRLHAKRRAHAKRMHAHRQRMSRAKRARAIRARKARDARKKRVWRARRAAEKRARVNLRRMRAALRLRLSKKQVATPAAPCTTCNTAPHITMKSTTLVVNHI